jgi:DNA gyrase subunit A
MEFVQGPDFPTGAHIWGQEGIRNAYVTGRGRVMVQADHKIEDIDRQERKRLVFNEIPFQVNKANLVAKIADLIKQRKIEGISEVRDESDRKGMRIVLELRRGAHVPVVLNNLYKHTNLRNSFSVNMIALVDGTPKMLTLKQALRHYIDFRVEVVRRRAEFDLKKAKARLHVLEGLRIAIDNLDRVIALIRASADVEEARSSLMSEFSLSEIQAQAILDMQLRRLAALEREKIENEYNELLKLVAELEALLSDSVQVLGVVRAETRELKRKYGDERRTEVHKEELGDWRREDTEPHEDVVITLSRNGYVKRVKLDTYKKQHRGGRGVRGQRMTKEDDVTPHLQIADTHDYLLFFTDQGRVFASRVFELPADQSRNSRGTPVQNLGFNMEPREEVQAVVAVSSYLEDTYLVMATKQGQVKRMHLPLLRNMNRSGLRCFNLKGDDGLIGAVIADDTEDVILVSKEGMSIRFKSSEVRARQRAAGGMKGMTVQGKDEIVSMNVVDDEGYLLIVSQKGYGKLSLLRHYTQQRRGGKGLITLKVTPKTGNVADSAVVSEDIRTDSTGMLVLVSEQAQVIRTNLGEIRSTGRIAQGVKIQVPDAGDKISAIRVIDERREAGAVIDPSQLENANEDGESDGENEAPDEATGEVEVATEESTED